MMRSTIFNILFYLGTILACFACLPALFFPREKAMWVVHTWLAYIHFLERNILKLRYEIRGVEHLPKSGAYIIAGKHQSPYETFKLHPIFKDPAIILKKELLRVPLWGQYLKKADVIAIDRSSREQAVNSIKEGALRVKKQCRPIVIFPQGTRVNIGVGSDEKPYKIGVARIQDATSLPIIPMALNTGYFWPKGRWCKKQGTVVFEFLPPISPGMERSALMNTLEEQIETHSQALLDEAIAKDKAK